MFDSKDIREYKEQLEFWFWYGPIEPALIRALGAPASAAPAPSSDSHQSENPGGTP